MQDLTSNKWHYFSDNGLAQPLIAHFRTEKNPSQQ
jgi:hypothetical protein